jgi:hypothetical protein
MELVKLGCNGCGADIELSEDARFVTCRYCDAKLEVKKTDGAIFTEVREAIEKISDDVAALKAENRVLRLQNEIEELDREWETRAKAMMLQGKDGSFSPPTRTNAMVLGAGSVVMFLVPLAMGVGTMILPGVAVASIFAIIAVFLYQKAIKYEAAVAEHQSQRAELERKLDKAERRVSRGQA